MRKYRSANQEQINAKSARQVSTAGSAVRVSTAGFAVRWLMRYSMSYRVHQPSGLLLRLGMQANIGVDIHAAALDAVALAAVAAAKAAAPSM